MTADTSPWFVRCVVGIGAWVTAVVLIVFAGVFLFSLLEAESPSALVLFGVAFFAYGCWLLWNGPSGVFGQQLGIATAAAGAALIAGGMAWAAETLWMGLFAAIAITIAIIVLTDEPILQFLAAAMAAGFYVASLFAAETDYSLNLIALATPVGLGLLLFQPGRRFSPSAVALLMLFPLISILTQDFSYWTGVKGERDTFAKVIHILLFLGLVYIHVRGRTDGKATAQVLGFAVGAVLVCVVLPAGASAAMLLLMLAFVIGSRVFAALGVVLQTQFIIRFYYSLEMNLFDKSLLLMGIGAVLLALWWMLHTATKRRVV